MKMRKRYVTTNNDNQLITSLSLIYIKMKSDENYYIKAFIQAHQLVTNLSANFFFEGNLSANL